MSAATIPCKSCGILFKTESALKRHIAKYCELSPGSGGSGGGAKASSASTKDGGGDGPAVSSPRLTPKTKKRPGGADRAPLGASREANAATGADDLLAMRRQQAKAGQDGKISELIAARQDLQTDLSELQHGYARTGNSTRATGAVKLHAITKRGNTLKVDAAAAAVHYAEKLQVLKDAKIREMRLVLAKAEEKEGLKGLGRKALLDRQKKGAYELELIEKERNAMRRQLQATELNLSMVHSKLDTKASKAIPGNNGMVLLHTDYNVSNVPSRLGNMGGVKSSKASGELSAPAVPLQEQLGQAERGGILLATKEGNLLWEAQKLLSAEDDPKHADFAKERSDLEMRKLNIEKQLAELQKEGTKALRRQKNEGRVHSVIVSPEVPADDDPDDAKQKLERSSKRPATTPKGDGAPATTNSVSNEATAMRERYLAQGGADPLVIRQIQDLEQTLNATARSGSGGLMRSSNRDGSGGGPMHSTGYGGSSMLGGGGGDLHLQNQLMRMELDQKRMQQDFMFSMQNLSHSVHGNGKGARNRARSGRGEDRYNRYASDDEFDDDGGQGNPHYHELKKLRTEAQVLKERAEIVDLRRALNLPVEGSRADDGAGARGSKRDIATPLNQDQDVEHTEIYNPPDGIALFLDFCSGLPSWLTACTISCEMHVMSASGGFDMPMYTMETVPVKATPDEGGTSGADANSGDPRGDVVLFPHGTSVISKFQNPDPDSFMYIRLMEGTKQNIKEKQISGETHSIVCLGWTKLYLFDHNNAVCAGRYRLQLRDPPEQKAASSLDIRKLPRAGPAEVCVRLVDYRLFSRHTRLDVVPNRKLYFPDGPIGNDVVHGSRTKTSAHAYKDSVIEFPRGLENSGPSRASSAGVSAAQSLGFGRGYLQEPSPAKKPGKGGMKGFGQGKTYAQGKAYAGGRGMTKLQIRKQQKAAAAAEAAAAASPPSRAASRFSRVSRISRMSRASTRVGSEHGSEHHTLHAGAIAAAIAARGSFLTISKEVGEHPIIFEVLELTGISIADASDVMVVCELFQRPSSEPVDHGDKPQALRDTVTRGVGNPNYLMPDWQSQVVPNVAAAISNLSNLSSTGKFSNMRRSLEKMSIPDTHRIGKAMIDDEAAFPFPFPVSAVNTDTVVVVKVMAAPAADSEEKPKVVAWHLFELFDSNGKLNELDGVMDLYDGKVEASLENMEPANIYERNGSAGIMLRIFYDGLDDDVGSAVRSEQESVKPTCPRECWNPFVRPEPPDKPYNFTTGGYDLYIDAAKMLPRNCTITRVTGRIFTASYGKQGGQLSANCDLDSSVCDPVFGFRLEFRDVEFDPQATLLVKIYTVEMQSKELVTVGYSALNIFTKRGTSMQPPPGEVSACSLNEGGHQLPVYQSAPDTSKELTMEAFENMKTVPCASLLVRLLHPPEVQGKMLSTSTVPKANWAEAGLIVARPPYADGSDGYYQSFECEPTKEEVQIFLALVKKTPMLVRECLTFINGDRRLKDDAAKKSWIRSRLTKASGGGNPGPINLTYVVPYSEKTGLTIAVDSAMNLPKTKIYYPVIRLTSEEEHTHSHLGPSGDFFGNVKMNWDKRPTVSAKHPEWVDGYKTIVNHKGDKTSALVVEIYPFGEKGRAALTPVAWGMMRVFTDDMDGKSKSKSKDLYCIGGKFKLPLYAGSPSKTMIGAFVSAGKGGQQALDRARAQRKIKYVDGASATLRMTDSRRHDEYTAIDNNDINDADVPKEKRFVVPGKSKSVLQALGKVDPDTADLRVEEWMAGVITNLRK